MLYLSPTHSLGLSAVLLAFPLLPFDVETPGKHFQVIIDYNKLFWFTSLFHLEVAHNNTYQSLRRTMFSEQLMLFRQLLSHQMALDTRLFQQMSYEQMLL
jgi:hypothetical protein